MRRLLLCAAPLLLANVDPTPIPPPVRAMLDAAFASGNETEVATIVKYARTAAPNAADAIKALADAWRGERQRHNQATIERARLFDLWKGRAELGGYLTTGNTRDKGATGMLDLTREGLRWRHKLHFQADYQESKGVTSREHEIASYEPNFKLDANRYLYGAVQYESDRFLGYYDRYSASVGAGYSPIKTPRVSLDLELGPAFRSTDFTDGKVERSPAARGSLNFNWRLSPVITLKQDASTYVQRYNSTVSGTTALNAKLIGPLSAQLSYNIQYESQPPVARIDTDTTGRAALVYSF